MAIRLDISKELAKQALDTLIASRKRAQNGTINPMIKEIINKELAELQTAVNTMTDTK